MCTRTAAAASTTGVTATQRATAIDCAAMATATIAIAATAVAASVGAAPAAAAATTIIAVVNDSTASVASVMSILTFIFCHAVQAVAIRKLCTDLVRCVLKHLYIHENQQWMGANSS